MITIRTELLLAVSRWAAPASDSRPHLSFVLFKGNEMVACDGRRLVRVPVACGGLTIAIDRDHIAAAAAAQEFCKDAAPRDEEYRGRAVEISIVSSRAVINVGRFAVHGALGDVGAYPPSNKAMPTERPDRHPDGYRFNPQYLAGIHEVEVAAGVEPGQRGVTITGWSSDGLGAMLFEGYRGIRYVIMPVRV
jgi:hypothetical protein